MEDKKKRITQLDVAKEAGVSRSLVSLVVCGEEGLVAEDSRRKILDAIDRLGYHSNVSAQKLRLGIDEYVANQIGLIVSNPQAFSNPFLSKIIANLHTAAHEKGCKIHYIRFFDELKDSLLFNKIIHPDEIGGLLLLDLSKNLQDDKNGIIMEKIKTRIKKTVAVEWKTPLFPCVYFDRYKSGKTAVEHLFARGYTKIGYVGPIDQRLSGIRDGMEENRLKVQGMIMISAHTMEDGFNASVTLVEQQTLPQAMICGSDEIAMGFLSFLKNKSIEVPKTVALLSMGNSEISQYTTPPLSTMDIKEKEIAQTAIDMILGGPYHQDSVLPVELIPRFST